jgi:hypothetical protein
MITNRVPKSACPACGYEMDCATNVSGERGIGPGDFSVCASCGHILRFTKELRMREAHAVELQQLRTDHPDVFELLTRAARLVVLENPLAKGRR